MPDDVTVEQLVRAAIGECAGYVSLCWEPKPSGVFDSLAAADEVDLAVRRVLSVLEVATESGPPRKVPVHPSAASQLAAIQLNAATKSLDGLS